MATQTMHAVQVTKAGAPFVCTEIPVPEPGHGLVRVRVHACGVCGGDAIVRNGLMGVTLPRVPGHEIGGVIDAIGEGVIDWRIGQRVGIGWHGDYCTTCEFCRAGDFTNCVRAPNRSETTEVDCAGTIRVRSIDAAGKQRDELP